MPSLTLTLPYPPSLNRMYRAFGKGGKVRAILSKEGREYYDKVRGALKFESVVFIPFAGRLAVTLHVHPPDKRRRDIDNTAKAVLDGLQKAGAYQDDSQIDDLRIVRLEKVKGGKVVVIITELVAEIERGEK